MALLVTLSSADVHGVERTKNIDASADNERVEDTIEEDLFNAAGEGNIGGLKDLFEKHGNKIKSTSVDKALLFAVFGKKPDTVQYLCSQKFARPTVNGVEDAVRGAIIAVVRPNRLEADANAIYGRDSTIIQRKNREILQFLLSKECSVSPRPIVVKTAFTRLIQNFNTSIHNRIEQDWLDLFSVIIENPENAESLCKWGLLDQTFTHNNMPDSVVQSLINSPSEGSLLVLSYLCKRVEEGKLGLSAKGLEEVIKTEKLTLAKMANSAKKNNKTSNIGKIQGHILKEVYGYLE